MFGFGPGYAELLRPDEAREIREEKEARAKANGDEERAGSADRGSDDEEEDDEEEAEESFIRHVRFANSHRQLQRSCTIDTEADALAHGIDRQLFLEWTRIFERLDQADGNADGLIDRKAFLKWLHALDLQKTIEFEANLGITPRELEKLITAADRNRDGFVDRSEFIRLVSNRDKQLSNKQQSLLHQYLRVAAYAEEYTCCPPPWFIVGVTLIQTSVYVYHVYHYLTHPDHEGETITWSGPKPTCSVLIFDPSRRHEAWRYLSYSCVHAGIQHILFNMVMQLFVGLPLELSHGSLRVGLVYVFGVVAGSLGTSAVDPNVFLAGASGGVYALIAAHLATLILNWQEDIVIMKKRFRTGKSTSAKHGHIVRFIRLVTVLTYGIVDTGVAAYNRHVTGDVRVSYVAHFMGAISGLLIGIIVLKNRKVEHWETKLKVVCVVVFFLLMLGMILWNIFGNELTHLAYGTNSTYFRPEEYYSSYVNFSSAFSGDVMTPKCHNYI